MSNKELAQLLETTEQYASKMKNKEDASIAAIDKLFKKKIIKIGNIERIPIDEERIIKKILLDLCPAKSGTTIHCQFMTDEELHEFYADEVNIIYYYYY